MITKEHIKSCLKSIKLRYAGIYVSSEGFPKLNEKQLLRQDSILGMIILINKWMDRFAYRKRYENGNYDYTWEACEKRRMPPMSHRERTHHERGISETIEKFTKLYGEENQEIIEYLSKLHVIQDFGYIPSERDYKKEDFWQNVIEREQMRYLC